MISRLKQIQEGRKSIATDTLWSLLHDGSQVVVAAFTFGVLGRELGTELYGDYGGLFGIITSLAGLAFAGINLAVMQRALREEDDITAVARSYLTLGFATGIISTVIALILGVTFLGSLSFVVLLLIPAAELIAVGLVRVAASVALSIAGFGYNVRISLGLMAVRLSVVAGLFFSDNLTLENLAIFWFAGAAAYSFFAVFVVLPWHGVSVMWMRPSQPFLRTAGVLSAPIVGADVRENGDKTVLAANAGFEADSGNYNAAFRIVQMASLPIQSINNAMFYRFLPKAENERGQHLRKAQLLAGSTLVLTGLISIVAFFAAPLLVDIFVGSEFDEAARMTRWLLLFFPIRALAGAPLNSLLGLGKTGVRAVILIGTGVFALVSYLILIPHYSWGGAVAGTVASEAVVAIWGWTALIKAQRAHDRALDERQAAEAAAADATA